MAIIIRCFESLLSLVRATLPVSRALAKLQNYGKKNGKKNKCVRSAILLMNLLDMKEFWHFRRNYLRQSVRSFSTEYNKLPNIKIKVY